MTRPRILFLTSGRDVPSSVFRVMEYLPRLRPLARVSLSPCRPPKDLSHRQIGRGGWPLDFLLFVGKAVSRLTAISRAPLHDLVFLEGELLAAWAPVLEKMALGLSPRTIFDLSGGIERLRPRAVGTICRRARHVIAGDEAAAEFARGPETRVWPVPTAIDTDRFIPGIRDGRTV
ncbi:MAG TPA: hypothetical protein VEN81_09310, partial [Planctomycetota bacterium]|nr:hypothetical protein [Planctomycetota bacterium]